MNSSRLAQFKAIAAELGHSFDGEIKIGGHYSPVVQHGHEVYVSGQIPRVGDTVMITGRVGAEASLAEAQTAAKICVMRALALLTQTLGSLDRIARVLRINVYVQSAEQFTQHSEVADGASDVLFAILGEAGMHTRTTVGVYQLPKNASVELDMVVAVEPSTAG